MLLLNGGYLFTAKYLGVECFLWSFLRNFPTATDFNFISRKYPRIRVIIKYLELTRRIIPFGRRNGFSAK